MDDLIERLMLFGYSDEDAEMIAENLLNSEGYNGAWQYIRQKESELYVD